jgi:hypothetical protein
LELAPLEALVYLLFPPVAALLTISATLSAGDRSNQHTFVVLNQQIGAPQLLQLNGELLNG